MNSLRGSDTDMDHDSELVDRTRRHFFKECAVGLGTVALGSLLNPARAAGVSTSLSADPLAPRPSHFRPRAKNVIYLFMAGGPSQLELFDYKPRLQAYTGKPIPESFVK